MRRANNIESMHSMSSRRGHEERSATTEPILLRESFAWLDTGSEESSKTAMGSKKTADERVNLAGGRKETADGRHRLPGGANNLPMDAFKLPIVGLNCRLTHLNYQLSAQVTRWEQGTTRGQLKSFGEHEKCSGEGSTWSVSTSFGPGTAQTARGRVNPIGGAVDMRLLEKLTDAGEFALPPVSASLRTTELAAAWSLCNNHAIQSRGSDGSSDFMAEKRSCYEISSLFQNVEMEYEHFSSCLGGVIPMKSGGRWLTEEESMSGEGISAPPHRCKRGPLLLKKEGKFKPVNKRLAARSSQLEAQKKLTIKYNNPPSKMIAGTTKNAHLSVWKTMGTGDNNLFPFFLISSTLHISSPVGGSPEGEGGSGIVANTNKTSAYET